MSQPPPRHFYGKLGMTDEEHRRALEADIARYQRQLDSMKCKTCGSMAKYLAFKIATYRKMLETKQY